MTTPRERFDLLDRRITGFMRRHSTAALRWSVGVVFVWFGALKFFPEASPAEDLVIRTVDVLTLGAVAPEVALPFLAVIEVTIGLGLLIGRALRTVLGLLGAQMVGTLAPLVLFPGDIWNVFPFVLTLEGQYILKNAVIIAAALAIGATVRDTGADVPSSSTPSGQESPPRSSWARQQAS